MKESEDTEDEFNDWALTRYPQHPLPERALPKSPESPESPERPSPSMQSRQSRPKLAEPAPGDKLKRSIQKQLAGEVRELVFASQQGQDWHTQLSPRVCSEFFRAFRAY
jgi:hypothetical protein